MSGTSSDQPCPICEKNMSVYSDYKPFENISGECIECGFTYWTKVGQMTLKEVNERRADFDLSPMKARQLEKHRIAIKRIW